MPLHDHPYSDVNIIYSVVQTGERTTDRGTNSAPNIKRLCNGEYRPGQLYMRQYQILSKFWQGKNIKTSVFRTCILITQNTEQVLRISELLSVIQNSYIYGNHGNFKMELTLPVHSCYESLTFFRRL